MDLYWAGIPGSHTIRQGGTKEMDWRTGCSCPRLPSPRILQRDCVHQAGTKGGEGVPTRFEVRMKESELDKGRCDHVNYLYHIKNDESRGKNDALEWHQRLFCIPYRIPNIDKAMF